MYKLIIENPNTPLTDTNVLVNQKQPSLMGNAVSGGRHEFKGHQGHSVVDSGGAARPNLRSTLFVI